MNFIECWRGVDCLGLIKNLCRFRQLIAVPNRASLMTKPNLSDTWESKIDIKSFSWMAPGNVRRTIESKRRSIKPRARLLLSGMVRAKGEIQVGHLLMLKALLLICYRKGNPKIWKTLGGYSPPRVSKLHSSTNSFLGLGDYNNQVRWIHLAGWHKSKVHIRGNEAIEEDPHVGLASEYHIEGNTLMEKDPPRRFGIRAQST